MNDGQRAVMDPSPWRRAIVPVMASANYLVVAGYLIGPRAEQFILVALFSGLYMASSITRRWILGFSIFIVFWVIFDLMKAFPNYTVNTVHIADLYEWERSWFGIDVAGISITPNEFLELHKHSVLDLLSGLFYLCWVPVPLAFAAYLFVHDKDRFLRFALTFLLVNLIGFVIYYLYPAAPPWYVKECGFDLLKGTPGNTAGLVRFDTLTRTSIFAGLYSKSSNVFAAMPSLHSAYPLLVLYTGIKARSGTINVFFLIVMVGIWFAAVYTSHHYILDVLAGILCAVAGIVLFEWLRKTSWGGKLFDKYVQVISG